MNKQTKSQGFSVIEALIIFAVVAVLGFAGWFIWQKNHKNEPTPKTNTPSQSSNNQSKPGDNSPDPYEGWQTHVNSTYGITFKYPPGWKIEEVSANSSSDSLLKLEYAINVKRSEEIKYNNTVAIEILRESLAHATEVHDRLFAQAPSNPLIKTDDLIKGRESVQYLRRDPTASDSKLYLLEVGDKTYLVRSINEWFTLQSDPAYWSKFNRLLESLEISK